MSTTDSIFKQAQIEQVADELLKGTPPAMILEKFGQMWNLKKSAINALIASAKELNIGRMSEINAAKEAELGEKGKELAEGILTALERQRMLSDIARGEVSYQKEVMTREGAQVVTTYPDFKDRVAAIKTLNEMDGANAPVKTDLSGAIAFVWNEVKTYETNNKTDAGT
jgi:hypothetical protein